MANISYIRLLQSVELFSKEHMQVKRFASDFPAQMPNFGTESEKYPIIFVSPSDNIFSENVTTFTIDIYCFDIIQKDRSNINNILSDTNLILSDLHRWYLDGEIFGLDIREQVTTTPIDNSLLDYAAGWKMTATFDVDTYGICEIPFINEPVILMEVNDVIYSTVLTCETLADCETFNNLVNLVDTKIGEAPIDGQQYVRQDAEWVVSTGVTFSQLLENVTPDGYLGLRLQPASASNNGFYINKSTNQSVGYYVRNTDNVGNAAVSALYLGGSGGLYDNYVSLFHANAGYSIPYLRNKNGLISNNDLFFIGWQGASFDFVTSTGTFGSETSKFRITNSGTVSIGVTPSLDNTTTDILGRKADGTIVRIDKSSIVVTGSYLPLAGGTMSADAGIFFANGSKISEGIVDAGTGGNKGIALTCAVGYEFKWEAGELYLTDLSGNYIDVKDYARSLPTVNDDITKGFVSGSNWRIGNQFYQCLDPTEGAAVWVQETDFGTLQLVTDNGNVTTNQINIYSDTNGLFIKNDSELNDNLILAAESIITFNDGGIVRKSIIDNQTLVFTKDSISKTISAGTYNTDENTILILPDKASGSYTFAMIDDIPTKTSDLINDGEDGINPFITLEDLPVLSLDELTDVEITSPTNNQIPAYESATNLWKNKSLEELVEDFNRTQGIYYFEEFMGQLNAAYSTSVNSIHNAVNNGQGTTRSTTSITNKTIQQGVIESLTNANSTGTAGFGYGSGQYKGSGSITMETYFNITTLSTLAERFFTIFGWITGSNLSNPANAILITYDEGGVVIPYAGGTPNFRCITRGGSTITNTISSVPVVAGQWYKLKINISSDGGTVTFFIDDTLVATHSTNLPLNTTAILPYSIIAKSSGTAARAMQTDYFMYKQIFTTPR